MKALLFFLLGIVVAIATPLAIIALGGYNIAASRETGWIEATFAPWTYDRSIETHASDQTNPFASAWQDGIDHYKESCVRCHGAPDVEADEFAQGLSPQAPDLAGEAVKELSDGELFWVIKHGVRMTGMPAMGEAHSDDDIWKIAAFVRHLPDITPEEKSKLKEGRGEHHGAEAAGGS